MSQTGIFLTTCISVGFFLNMIIGVSYMFMSGYNNKNAGFVILISDLSVLSQQAVFYLLCPAKSGADITAQVCALSFFSMIIISLASYGRPVPEKTLSHDYTGRYFVNDTSVIVSNLIFCVISMFTFMEWGAKVPVWGFILVLTEMAVSVVITMVMAVNNRDKDPMQAWTIISAVTVWLIFYSALKSTGITDYFYSIYFSGIGAAGAAFVALIVSEKYYVACNKKGAGNIHIQVNTEKKRSNIVFCFSSAQVLAAICMLLSGYLRRLEPAEFWVRIGVLILALHQLRCAGEAGMKLIKLFSRRTRAMNIYKNYKKTIGIQGKLFTLGIYGEIESISEKTAETVAASGNFEEALKLQRLSTVPSMILNQFLTSRMLSGEKCKAADKQREYEYNFRAYFFDLFIDGCAEGRTVCSRIRDIYEGKGRPPKYAFFRSVVFSVFEKMMPYRRFMNDSYMEAIKRVFSAQTWNGDFMESNLPHLAGRNSENILIEFMAGRLPAKKQAALVKYRTSREVMKELHFFTEYDEISAVKLLDSGMLNSGEYERVAFDFFANSMWRAYGKSGIRDLYNTVFHKVKCENFLPYDTGEIARLFKKLLTCSPAPDGFTRVVMRAVFKNSSPQSAASLFNNTDMGSRLLIVMAKELKTAGNLYWEVKKMLLDRVFVFRNRGIKNYDGISINHIIQSAFNFD